MILLRDPVPLPGSQEADAFYARFAPDGTPVVETREVAPNVNIDLDKRGDLVGFEVASRSPSRAAQTCSQTCRRITRPTV